MKVFIDLILGILFVAYYILINLLSSRKIAFSNTFLVIGVFLILYYFSKKKLKENKSYSKVSKVFKKIICIGLLIFVTTEAMIILYPKQNKGSTEYIMVLGAGLNNRSEISLTLKDRLDSALECINDHGNNGYIVVSGGQGADEDISEAEAMKRYLVNNGVPEDRIIKEDKSRNTYENFKFSKGKIEENSNRDIGESSVKIITTDFHALRSSMLAKRNGFKNISLYTSNTVFYLIPVFYSREALAIGKSFLFDR